MDVDRRVVTMDLLRRFGSEMTLSAGSLVFNHESDPSHFSDSEVSLTPSFDRFRSLDDDHNIPNSNAGKMVVTTTTSAPEVAKNKPIPNFRRNSKDPDNINIYGQSRRNSDTKLSALAGLASIHESNEGSQPGYQLVANLNALSNQLASGGSHHVHFPTGDINMVKRTSSASIVLDQKDRPRKESLVVSKETIHIHNGPHSAPHLLAELSKHMSVLYCILITIASASLSISSTLTKNIDSTIPRWFNTGLLAVGIMWLAFAFLYLFRKPSTTHAHHLHLIGLHHYDQPEEHHTHHERFVENDVDSGSFYLKMGATAFAVGSMIYACLELGVFIENGKIRRDASWVMGIYPCLFIIYVLLQLYFIFKNSQFKITVCRAASRFGLAHLVATDICIWIRTLLDETLHEFTELKQKQIKEKGGNMSSTDFIVTEEEVQAELGGSSHHSEASAETFTTNGFKSVCSEGDSIMHEMLGTASMFLYPCMIEYALITAGIIYVMWQSVGKNQGHGTHDTQHPQSRRHPRMFSVDCSHAANGMFAGVLVIVLTVVGLIFYFLYINSTDEDKGASEQMAGFCADILDVSLNSIGLIAVLYCSVQFCMKLKRIHVHNLNMELDDGLLLLTMIGVYAYSVMNVIGSFGGEEGYNVLSIAVDILELVQATLQTVFIFDASQRVLEDPRARDRRNSVRRESNPEKIFKALHLDKPGREMLTLLLAVNFGQWAIDIMCTLRAETNSVQREFFGTQQWAVLLHVTVPLVIFYRFHSTVCLFDIWKHSYKIQRPNPPPHHSPRPTH